jgi:alpha-1,6-mannosyltransferase
MLPNTFALAVILQAYSFWLDGRVERAAALVVFTTCIFRCDILLLLASLGLSWLVMRQLTVLRALKIGLVTGVVSLLLTVPLDSLLWQRPLWPEGEVFYFNTILGKSSEWGTSPWHWYFTSALPKSMLLTLLLVPLSILRVPDLMVGWERRILTSIGSTRTETSTSAWIDRTWLPFLVPVLGFILLYSNLGHKEMRFIFPALPILNLASASSMSRLGELAKTNKDKAPTLIGRLVFYFGIFCIILSFIGSLAFVGVSKWNYPGGESLLRLSDHIQRETQRRDVSNPKVVVYMDVASAMSGVSLFGQRAVQYQIPTVSWTFVKAGYEDVHSILQDVDSFTHALSESPEMFVGFVVVEEILGTPRLDLRKFSIETKPSIFVLEKRDFWQS